jgi:hypothetical protein
MRAAAFTSVLLFVFAIAHAGDDFQPPEIGVVVTVRTIVYARCDASVMSKVQADVSRYIGAEASARYRFLRWRFGKSTPAALTVTIMDDRNDVVMRYSVAGEKDLTRQLFGASLATMKTASTPAECDERTIEKDLEGVVDRVLAENGGNVFVEDLLRDVPLRRALRITPARSVVVPLYADCIHAAAGSLLRVSSTFGNAPTNDTNKEAKKPAKKDTKRARLNWTLRPSDPWADDDCYGCLETIGRVAEGTNERDPAELDWKQLTGRNISDDYVFMTKYRLADRRQVDGRVLPQGVDCAK